MMTSAYSASAARRPGPKVRSAAATAATARPVRPTIRLFRHIARVLRAMPILPIAPVDPGLAAAELAPHPQEDRIADLALAIEGAALQTREDPADPVFEPVGPLAMKAVGKSRVFLVFGFREHGLQTEGGERQLGNEAQVADPEDIGLAVGGGAVGRDGRCRILVGRLLARRLDREVGQPVAGQVNRLLPTEHELQELELEAVAADEVAPVAETGARKGRDAVVALGREVRAAGRVPAPVEAEHGLGQGLVVEATEQAAPGRHAAFGGGR